MAKRLALIAGHGGIDPGAVGNGYKEAEVARQIGNALQAKLKDLLTVFMYDQSKDFYKSKEWAKFTANDVVIEIHLNAFNGTAKGTEVLIKDGYTADAMDNGLLASMAKYFVNRGIKKRSDLGNMNGFASRKISYRLIEVCFIDNAADMKILMDNFDKIMTDMANAILKAMGATGTASGSGNTTTSGSGSTSSTKVLYRVRKTWADAKSQKDAFEVLANAKACADKNPGYSVFDANGKSVYTSKAASSGTNTSGSTTTSTKKKDLITRLQKELNTQFKAGLTVDGIWGPKTLAAVVTVKKGAKGNITKVLQEALILHGYSVGSSGADGDFGTNTEAAVKKFQKAKGLTQDGIAGKNTFAALLG